MVPSSAHTGDWLGCVDALLQVGECRDLLHVRMLHKVCGQEPVGHVTRDEHTCCRTQLQWHGIACVKPISRMRSFFIPHRNARPPAGRGQVRVYEGRSPHNAEQ